MIHLQSIRERERRAHAVCLSAARSSRRCVSACVCVGVGELVTVQKTTPSISAIYLQRKRSEADECGEANLEHLHVVGDADVSRGYLHVRTVSFE